MNAAHSRPHIPNTVTAKFVVSKKCETKKYVE